MLSLIAMPVVAVCFLGAFALMSYMFASDAVFAYGRE